MGIHARSRHRELNTLTCVIMGLEGWKTTIELHNDAYVTGLVTEVDSKMNMEVENAQYTDGNGKMTRLEVFHVRGRKIRFVHIPDQVNIMDLIERRVAPRLQKQQISKKSHIARKRNEQTLRRIRREQEERKQQH